MYQYIRGDRLKAIRDAAHLSQEQLSKDIGAAESRIWDYENKHDANPSASVLIKLATHLHVSVDYLLGLSESPVIGINPDLSPNEADVLRLWREGNPMEAIRIIASQGNPLS